MLSRKRQSDMSDNVIELTAGRKVEGMRVDAYLASLFTEYSRSVIQKVIEAGGVQVNGRLAKSSYKVRHDDHVRVEFPPPTHDLPEAEDIPLEVLYEDEYLALINKPADMVVHPAKGHWSGTLVNAILHRFDELSTVNGEQRSGIVHRLDRDTSGVILIAKEEQTHRDLSMQFELRKIFKEYRALVNGVLDRDSDYIEGRITRHPHDRVKMTITDDEEEGRDACTYYEVIERFRGYSYVRCHPRTGRTHQLRVHLASLGCPILADKVYSSRDSLRASDLAPDAPDEMLLSRQALHAYRLRFQHPRTGKIIEAEAPLPDEFQKALEALRKYRCLS